MFYLEKSMFNYYFDLARDGHFATVAMFEAIGQRKYAGYVSEYVISELEDSSEPKSSEMLALVDQY
jgi:hypothetical protein